MNKNHWRISLRVCEEHHGRPLCPAGLGGEAYVVGPQQHPHLGHRATRPPRTSVAPPSTQWAAVSTHSSDMRLPPQKYWGGWKFRAHLPVHEERGHPWEGVSGGLLPAHYLLGRPRLAALARQGGTEPPLEPRELLLHAVIQQIILDDSAHEVVWHGGLGAPRSQNRMPGPSKLSTY